MKLPEVVTAPTKVLGTATAVVTVFVGVFTYGQANDRLGMIIALLLPIVILAVLAARKPGFRSWLFLLGSWVLGVLALGYLVPGT
ncbi:MAG: hypothetical protein ACRDMV_14555 [Streptosporangiales bacterium]